jgi:hypothetical protein
MKSDMYTYKNWLDGEVVLRYATIYKSAEIKTNPIIVDWKNFNQEDIKKIKLKQIEIFDKQKNIFVSNERDRLSEEYKNSSLKEKFISLNITRWNEILSGKLLELTALDSYCTSDNTITFPSIHYQEMIAYYNSFKIGGLQYDFSNIHSENCPYKLKTHLLPEIIVEVILKLKNELNEWESDFPPKEKTKESNYPLMFKDAQAESLFFKLIKEIKNRKPFQPAYSYIFHKMRGTFNFKYNLINISFSKKDYSNFLKNTLKAKKFNDKFPKGTLDSRLRKDYLFDNAFFLIYGSENISK